MTLMQLTYFMEIVRTKNFTVAASNLYVAQSSLSYAIRELERELDVPLFVRRPNKQIELTMYGETLVPYAEESLRLIDEGRNQIISLKNPYHGKVRLAFFHSIVFSAIPALLSRFRSDNPDNEIEFETLVHHNWADFRQMLLDCKCDLVFSAGNIGDGCESRKIAEHRIYLIAPWSHPLSDADSVKAENLRNEHLIQIDAGSNMDTSIHQMFDSIGANPHITYVPDWTAQQLYVVNGKGLALSCDVACDERYVRKVPVDDEHALLPLYLTWSSQQKLSGAAAFVRDYYLKLAEAQEELQIF